MQIDRRLRLVANRAFGVAKALPYRDDDEGKQHGIEDADDGKFEPGHLVVQAEPVHAVEVPRYKHEANGVDAGGEDEQERQAPQRKLLIEVKTHCPRPCRAIPGPFVPETGDFSPPHRTPRYGAARPLAKPPSPRHIRLMPHRIAKTFGSRAEPRAVTSEQA